MTKYLFLLLNICNIYNTNYAPTIQKINILLLSRFFQTGLLLLSFNLTTAELLEFLRTWDVRKTFHPLQQSISVYPFIPFAFRFF